MNTDHRARHGRYVSLLWHCLWYGSIIRRFSIANTTPSQPHLRGIEPVGRSAVLFFGPPKMGGLVASPACCHLFNPSGIQVDCP